MTTDRIQEALRASKLDGWLFFDHHHRDPLAYRILELSESLHVSRRWYYFIPAHGEPQKLVHRIESGTLNDLPGRRQVYSSWVEQQQKLAAMLSGCRRIAMQYSPNCAIPYVSLVDGGTLELVRAAGVEIVSSADLVQQFEARLSEAQFESHIESGKRMDQIRREAFELIGERIRARNPLSEFDVYQFIRRRFEQSGLESDHGPIVAVNANASDPHYEPSAERTAHIQCGDVVLIDLFARLVQPGSIFYDITWTGFCGDTIPDRVQNIFEIVRDARKKATDLVIRKIGAGERLAGFEVDDAARGHIESHGLGEYFFHRTGHSIATEIHGTGANMDNLESHDERQILAGSCFSVEPGIYLPEFGIRSEVNMYVGDGFAKVTGEQQEQLVFMQA
ncbi:MAG TPA: M24 family metallopeptidase [Bryobacteraceae bacterium]